MFKKVFKIFTIILLLFLSFILAVNIYVLSFSKEGYFKEVENLKEIEIALVLWASVRWNKEPSDILKDRLNVASEAYLEWKIKKIIVSWDNSKDTYNEPLAMQKFLIETWVNPGDIYPDYAGFDTYDSIYRAKEIFWAESLLIFTQDFHLKRAMYISNRLWIKTYGIETNLHTYVNRTYNSFREVLARIKAFFDIEVLKSKPKFLWEEIEIVSNEKVEKTKELILEK